MRSWISKLLLPTAAAGMLGFGLFHSFYSERVFAIPRSEPPLMPSRNPFGQTIAAYGLVEAKTENIAVGTTLPGVIRELMATPDRVGQLVRAGDPLFRVDDRHLQAQQSLYAAKLKVAEAELARLEALPRSEELPASEAKVRAAQANVGLWQDQAARSERLIAARVVTEEQNVERQLKLEVARQELARAQADDQLLRAGAWRQDREVARARVELARAELEQVNTELERSLVRAPVDGVLLRVNVRPGEYVGTSPGQALVLLGDSRQLHVRAEIDENDLPRFQPGAPAQAFIRGGDRQPLRLRFVRVEPFVQPKRWLTSDNTERVDTRVLQVIYAVENPPPHLFVGQTLDVFLELSATGLPAAPPASTSPPAAETPAAERPVTSGQTGTKHPSQTGT